MRDFSYKSKPLIIFEIANNHFGSVEHGRLIISEFSKFLTLQDFKFAIKFQYRDLDNLIHKSYFNRKDEYPYLKRFLDTKLADQDFLKLKNYASELGFLTVCTPFDEISVKKIVEHGFDILKIASASFTDWPLLEEIVKYSLPVVASTAGANSIDLRRSISFLSKRISDLTIMHCVAEYPTLDNKLNLNRLDFLRDSFKDLKIGYSAHENPNNFEAVGIAYSKGARVFEKHIGVNSNNFLNNKYTCTFNQIKNWLNSLLKTIDMCENLVNDFEPSDTELNTLNSLRRGVYALRDIEIGEKITTLNTFFAIPTHSDQLLTNDLSKFAEWISKTVIKKNEPIYRMNLKKFSERELVEEFALEAKNTLALAGIVLPDKVDFEISHHYGVNQFDTIGLVLLTIINRDYCKKYLVLKAGQSNPEHFHELKEETFYCVQGQVELTVENIKKFLKPGDLVVIPRGKKHSFTSNTGAIIEEISSTSIVDDSYYTDPKINSNNNRKSKISLWK